ncbi:MAG: 3-hydroxy-3-methylglutaryl-coenzyme A reductase [Candidatus Heimdallarchaeota archaeon LC_2]|nr:MAG: 3-hydroxy-3-methylglutaryl-coenzyme A reductase [Candidatus Heimdallarchaeota archaeon LC_2]
MTFSSRIPGFHKLTQDEKLNKLKGLVDLSDEEIAFLKVTESPVTIENVIGVMTLPIGLATNFIINGQEKLVTFALEEASVVAAASNLARMTRDHGGFETSNTGALMIGQIQVLDLQMPYFSAQQIHSNKEKILKLANKQDPILVKFGGGAEDLETRVISTAAGDMLIVHLIVNCLDAMGANAVNTMAEAIAPMIADITGGRVILRIISNFADKRIVRARAVFDKEMLGGDDIVDAMIDAWAFAEADPYRAATHNKGIMNAISAVTVATANDWRAIEAGAHVYASRSGYYTSLTRYEITEEGHLAGTIELPVAVGIVGGATRVHPVAQINLKIMQVKSALELAEIIACAGLAQNAAALRALSDEGIQKGHMRLHARNLAGSLDGVTPEEVDIIAQEMIDQGQVRADTAQKILNQIRSS